MNWKRFSFAALGCAVLLSAGTFALETRDDEMHMPEPTPEHASLMETVGTWDCVMKMWEGPGEPTLGTGVEVNRALGPFHVISEFESEAMGMPFQGHSVISWDARKQKFISLWIDTFEPTPIILEGSYDEETKALTFAGEGIMMGQQMKLREVCTTADADHRTFSMYITPPGSEEILSMQIEYTRRK